MVKNELEAAFRSIAKDPDLDEKFKTKAFEMIEEREKYISK